MSLCHGSFGTGLHKSIYTLYVCMLFGSWKFILSFISLFICSLVVSWHSLILEHDLVLRSVLMSWFIRHGFAHEYLYVFILILLLFPNLLVYLVKCLDLSLHVRGVRHQNILRSVLLLHVPCGVTIFCL